MVFCERFGRSMSSAMRRMSGDGRFCHGVMELTFCVLRSMKTVHQQTRLTLRTRHAQQRQAAQVLRSEQPHLGQNSTQIKPGQRPSMICDSVPQGRLSRSEWRTVDPVAQRSGLLCSVLLGAISPVLSLQWHFCGLRDSKVSQFKSEERQFYWPHWPRALTLPTSLRPHPPQAGCRFNRELP